MNRIVASSAVILFVLGIAGAQQNPGGLYTASTGKVADRFVPLPPSQVRFTSGLLYTRFQLNETQRLLKVDENDLLGAFEHRDQSHQAWQGEHVGKFLHAATLTWANTRNPALRAKIDRVAKRLIATQEPDGYLGTYQDKAKWTDWDVWVHKYDLLGLLTVYQFTGNSDALRTCRNVGDLLVRTFGHGPGQRDINKAGEHVGMAATSVLEPIALLYRATSDPKYLAFAHYIVENYDGPGGPRVISQLAATGSVVKVADAKAYEMLSNFLGILETYRVTGDGKLMDAMLAGWGDIVKKRLYITGSGSSYECWTPDGNLPNEEKIDANETCVTVSWEQMNLQMLRLTGQAKYADQAERTIYNQLLGAQKPTGEAWDYYTSLNGHKPYTTSTNCCLSSGPRGVALLPSIAYMTSADGGIVVNLFASSEATAKLPGGAVTLRQTTGFPATGEVDIEVSPGKNPGNFPIRIRMPGWARVSDVRLDGRQLGTTAPVKDGYLVLSRNWRMFPKFRLDFPMAPKVVAGVDSNSGRVAVTYGPLVFAADSALNPSVGKVTDIELESTKVVVEPMDPTIALPVGEFYLLAAGRTAAGAGSTGGQSVPIILTPFAFAGENGKSTYAVWLKMPKASK